MTVLSKIDYLKKLLFYNVFIEKPKIKQKKRKDPIVQLEASKLSTKDSFSDLINKIKGFKYEITVNVLLKKYKPNGEKVCSYLF